MDYIKRLLTILVPFFTGCGLLQEEGAGGVRLAPIFGWLDSHCFAVQQSNLSSETEILVVILDDPQTFSFAQIVGPASAQRCGPLASDRRERNESEGLHFYEVKSDQSFDLAIGVIGEISEPKIMNQRMQADVGGDGTIERFSHCATSDGISFDVWASAPYEQAPIWSGFYYLGYDVERNCP